MQHFRGLFSRKPSSSPSVTTEKSSFQSILSYFTSNHSKHKSNNHHHHRIRLNMDSDLPKIFITADTNEFDPAELAKWQAEGYEVQYLPRADTHALELLADSMESDEKYCIIAYGTAATIALEYAMYPVSSLAALVAYYPTGLPSSFPSETFPRQIHRILLHISDSQPVAIDTSKSNCSSLKLRLYQDTKPGFAEKATVNYNPVASNLAFSRTLGVIKEALGPEIDLEDVWGEHLLYEFVEKDVDKTMDTMVKEPYVNHIPTLTGGIGYTDLHRFYRDFFIPHNPASLRLRLISRTVGTDRIVDEMICSFTHTSEIHWMLPGVEPTNRKVEVAIVSIVCVRGKKLYHEHIYWDQATVLKQIGAVDFGGLPVAGPEAAWKVEDKGSVPSNMMIKGWEKVIEKTE